MSKVSMGEQSPGKMWNHDIKPVEFSDGENPIVSVEPDGDQ
jgi:hypothetical protein